MRFFKLALLLVLPLLMPAQAQEAEFPRLGALTELEIPPFRLADMIGRATRLDADYAPPPQPPQYELGERQAFQLRTGENGRIEAVEMELRGMTDKVLIWAQHDLEYPRWRAGEMAKRAESEALQPMRRLFQYAEPPGVDGDPRLHIALALDPQGDSLGHFPKSSTAPQTLDAKSNQREMLVITLDEDENFDFFDDIMIEVIAHEYLHLLHHYRDYGEELWLDEALASYAAYVAGRPLFRISGIHNLANSYLAAPHVGLTHWQIREDIYPKYGAGLLFMVYLAERFGEAIMPRLLAEPANGWRAIEKVLRETAAADANEVFADWALANYFLDYRRGYGYRYLEAELRPPETVAAYNSFPARRQGSLDQYSADYIAIDARGASRLRLRLRQAAETRLVDAEPIQGDHVYYAPASDYSHNRLTRAFNLSHVQYANLSFKLWHDLERDLEWAYVSLSKNQGKTWETLSSRQTEPSRIYSDYVDEGYTGRTGGWRTERISLRDYLPGRILIRFEVVSSIATKYGGMAIDDIEIHAIGYRDGFESADDAWIAEGWLRTDNRLPNQTWLQAAQVDGQRLHVSRALLSGPGELLVELLPGASQTIVAISPVTPLTSLPTDYALEIDLLDAAGEILTVSRACSLTTTHALNFRDAPNGTKIGLLPKGATVDGLKRDGDWFQVEFRGRRGWVHGGYALAAGDCP